MNNIGSEKTTTLSTAVNHETGAIHATTVARTSKPKSPSAGRCSKHATAAVDSFLGMYMSREYSYQVVCTSRKTTRTAEAKETLLLLLCYKYAYVVAIGGLANTVRGRC